MGLGFRVLRFLWLLEVCGKNVRTSFIGYFSVIRAFLRLCTDDSSGRRESSCTSFTASVISESSNLNP